MDPIPILFLDHAAGLGGAERSLLLLLKHLDRRRFVPHLAAVEGPLAREARALGVVVHPVTYPRLRRSPRAPLDLLRGGAALARLARRLGVRVLHGNTVRASLYGALAARLARRPFLWHMRDFWLSEARPRLPALDRAGKGLLCAAARGVIANSAAVAAGLPCPSKVRVVHNGIEVEAFDPGLDGDPFRRRYGIPAGVPLVGTVGRLRPWKGQDRFLRAMARVAREVPEAWFAVVGGSPFGVDDGYPQRLRTLATELGIADRTVFTGQLADVRPALAAFDLFVHPGDPEPFGLVNLEAMAMALPVVAFAHGALPEIVVHGGTGLLVPPGDEGALAEAVVALLRDPDRARALGQAGRRRVEGRFRIQVTVAQVEEVLAEVVG